MRSLLTLALLVGACTPDAMLPPPANGTTRVFGGERVAGHYVSPSAYQHYIQAQLASLWGDSQYAVDELRRALASDGASPYLRARLAEELLALGRLDEAREELEGALRVDPRFAEAYVDLGRVQLQLGDSDAAERSFRRAFELDRACEDAYLALAALYQDRGDAQRADELYHLMGERVPRSAIAHLHLAHGASRRGELSVTEEELRKALDIEPGFVDACRELGALLIADGRADKATRDLRLCFERSGGDLGAAELLVAAEQAAGRAQSAERFVDKLAEQSVPVDRSIGVGWLMLDRHLAPRALALCDGIQAARIGADDLPGYQLLRGAALEEVGRPVDALATLRLVPPRAPEFVKAQVRIAQVLARADRLPEAIDGLKKALLRGDASADRDALIAALADVEERAGDHGAALRLVRSALQVRPRSDVLAYALARVLVRVGQWDEALVEARGVLRRRPDDGQALSFVGAMLAEEGTRLDEARELLERAVHLDPTSGEYADSLGWVDLKLGRIPEAERYLARAGRLRGDSPSVLAHLGALYLKQGDRARALDCYRRALAQHLEEPQRHAVEEQLLLLEHGRLGAR